MTKYDQILALVVWETAYLVLYLGGTGQAEERSYPPPQDHLLARENVLLAL